MRMRNACRSQHLSHILVTARTLAAFLLVLLVLTGTGFANEVRIGLHGGLSVPNIQGGTNERSEGYSSRLGPYFGFFAEYAIRPHLSLRGEINYSSQGGKRNGVQPITSDQLVGVLIPGDMTLYADFNNETILDYIEIPVMAKLSWGRTTRLFADLGPYVGFLVRAKTVTDGTSQIYMDSEGTTAFIGDIFSFDATTDVKGDINSTNTGIAGGVGVETPFGPGAICLDAHFSTGLTNIQKDIAVNGKNHTGAVAVLIGYSYPL